MPLRFFNTLSRTLEEFQSRDTKNSKIDIYTCGPTVYSRAHIGNFRAYIFEDLLQRHLEARGFKVHRVMNLTDVDDKTIRGAREAKVPLDKFTQQFMTRSSKTLTDCASNGRMHIRRRRTSVT